MIELTRIAIVFSGLLCIFSSWGLFNLRHGRLGITASGLGALILTILALSPIEVTRPVVIEMPAGLQKLHRLWYEVQIERSHKKKIDAVSSPKNKMPVRFANGSGIKFNE